MHKQKSNSKQQQVLFKTQDSGKTKATPQRYSTT